MPKWTTELDSILIHGVFEEYNISFGKDLCERLAARVIATGNECSSKAVNSRLHSWKKKNAVKSTAPASTPAKKGTTVPKTPTNSCSRVNKSVKEAAHAESGYDSGGLSTPDPESPSINRKKRARLVPRKSYAESDSETLDKSGDYFRYNKRVKSEPKDDEDVAATLVGGLDAEFGEEI